MALTPDQRAMLELLLERGQSYEQIGSLLGVELPEVRKRARAALTELGGADPDADVALTDYLLGQADPIGRADAVRHVKGDAGARELAEKLIAQLQVIAPKAELPQLPGAAPRPASATPDAAAAEAGAKPAKPPKAERRRFLSSLDRRQRQLFAALGGFLVLVVAVAIAVSGVFGGDEDSANDEQQQAAQEGLTQVKLQPSEEGSAATGVAVFGRVRDQPVLQVNAANLPPTAGNQVYVVWLVISNEQAFPIALKRVRENGNLSEQAVISQGLIQILPQFQFVDISLSSPGDVERVVGRAERAGRRGQSPIPAYSGTSVLRGQIPNSVRTGNPEG